ncbi:MAG: endolytic transglycosylase MltG [Nitrospirae bacterium]|nr:endolytic transglycosylase MltG [Nitrospirota bacterium]
MLAKNRTIIDIFFVTAAIMFLFIFSFYLFLYTPPSADKLERVIEISEGMSFRAMADLLKREHLITNKTYFILLGRYTLLDRKVMAGEYGLNARMLPEEILTKFKYGKILLHEVAIPEGYTAKQIAQLLSEKKLADYTIFMNLIYNKEFALALGVNSPTLEGYLFPDTYLFPRKLKAEEIVGSMVKKFFTVYTPDLVEKAQMLRMTTNEVVTLASIIEKETSNRNERTLVSAVFHNRLRKGIPLQSDPTVIYALPNFNGDLTKADLKTKTAYNTYKRKGLPPGPISNPGRESIVAALYPIRVDYLFFVSKNDGTHYFSTSLSEHNQAVRLYQRRGV